MKTLAAIALIALTLTGCGTQLAPASTTAGLAAKSVTASAKREGIQLYGSFIIGKVLAAKTLTHQDENGKTFQFQELTVDAKAHERGDEHGKIIFRVITGNPLATVGQTVESFVNYTVISRDGGTFINTPGKPFMAHDLKIVK
jgi:hypothetical protein